MSENAGYTLISGGSGFIGTAFCTTSSDEVIIVDSFHPQVHKQLQRSSRLVVPGDVCDPETWRRVFGLHGLPKRIIHLAAETGTGQSLTESRRHAYVNVVGLATLLDALSFRKACPEQILLTSSRAVYGEGSWVDTNGSVFYPEQRSEKRLREALWDFVGPENDPASPLAHVAGQTLPKPVSVYGTTKLAQEDLLRSWCNSFGVACTILRLQNVYGAGQAVDNSYTGVLTFFAREALSKNAINVYEDGNIVRDFVNVTDVVEAIQRVLDRPSDGPVRMYDVGSGSPQRLDEVAISLARLANAPQPRISGDFRLGDVRAASADTSKITTDLGWKPSVSLEDGLQQLLTWVDAQTST